MNLARGRAGVAALLALALSVAVAAAVAAPSAAGAPAVAASAATPATTDPSGASAAPRVTLVWVQGEPTVRGLADAGLSPGLLSAGLGSVPAQQTYLDVSQGNRVFGSLYDEALPPLQGSCPAWRRAVEERAASAPADIVPWLLAATLADAGVEVTARGRSACALGPRGGEPAGPGRGRLLVRDGNIGELPALVAGLRGEDLLIAVAAPPPPSGEQLQIGIAGRGFAGELRSPSTRLDGYVLSTDLAPTILRRFDLAVPSEMAGRPIEAAAAADPAAVEALDSRLAVISERRGSVIGLTLLAWVVALALAAVLGGAATARVAVRIAALSVVLLPTVLLAAAALEPSQGAELALAALGSPLLGALGLRLLGSYRALGAAAALTVGAYGLDVLLGSPLTSLSLLGPNPGLGARFYGIGNELEALLAVLVVAGSGAALAGFAPRAGSRAAALAFLATGLAAAFVFAAGRFGADVGAAIVMPVGAAVAAATVAPGRRRTALAVLAVPLLALALLALADLLSGAQAHLTRSVLDAGGLGELADVAERRLRLSARSFARPVLLAFLPVVAALALAAWLRRDRLRAWVAGVPTVRAGLLGALAATAVGTLANDSGALLLEIGTAYLLVFVGFAWAESDATRHSPTATPHDATAAPHDRTASNSSSPGAET